MHNIIGVCIYVKEWNKKCFNHDLCEIVLSKPKNSLKTNNTTAIFRGHLIRGKAIL